MNHGAGDAVGRIEEEIEEHILAGSKLFYSDHRNPDGSVYVIKYFPSKRLGSFLASGRKLYASDLPGFTWGDGIYVAPLGAPLTSMMFGRIGLVGKIEPKRIYDATGPTARRLY
jgi:hypothetical protein